MKFPRRTFLHPAAGAAALPIMSCVARAQTYPSRPVRLIVTVAAGGSPDIIARLIGQWLSERLWQPFFVDNRPGASGNIGTEIVVRASRNGVRRNRWIDFHDKRNGGNARYRRDVADEIEIEIVVERRIDGVRRDDQHQRVAAVAYAKANPGKINMASGGTGSPLHVAGELFKMMAGVDMIHVPYRSETLALPDLISVVARAV
jgi:tripartite-type tricarboxylate transporter receptor subunit TctC